MVYAIWISPLGSGHLVSLENNGLGFLVCCHPRIREDDKSQDQLQRTVQTTVGNSSAADASSARIQLRRHCALHPK